MDKVINIKEELGEVIITLKDGRKITSLSKTIYTEYQSGRKDCTVQIQKPIELGGAAVQPGV